MFTLFKIRIELKVIVVDLNQNLHPCHVDHLWTHSILAVSRSNLEKTTLKNIALFSNAVLDFFCGLRLLTEFINVLYTFALKFWLFIFNNLPMHLRMTLLGPPITIENAPVTFGVNVVTTNTYVVPTWRWLLNRNGWSSRLSSSSEGKFLNGLSGLKLSL